MQTFFDSFIPVFERIAEFCDGTGRNMTANQHRQRPLSYWDTFQILSDAKSRVCQSNGSMTNGDDLPIKAGSSEMRVELTK
jgi:hypothetical protein